MVIISRNLFERTADGVDGFVGILEAPSFEAGLVMDDVCTAPSWRWRFDGDGFSSLLLDD